MTSSPFGSWARPCTAVRAFRDGSRLAARQVRGPHRILVIRLAGPAVWCGSADPEAGPAGLCPRNHVRPRVRDERPMEERAPRPTLGW